MHHPETISRARTELLVWEAEGGAIDAPADASRPAAGDALLLERLGAALVREWDTLPMPVQRAVYDRAAPADAGRDGQAARRDLARFLHDHKQRPTQG